MSSPVELIVGPARSGKGRCVLEAYRAALADAGPGKTLMLVPTALRRRATESRLLAVQPGGVLVRPQVLTLPDLADRLLTAAGRPVRRIGELARRQVIRRCLSRLGDREAAVLGAALRTPGLVESLDPFFRELKAARIEPDAFGRALTGGLRSPRNRVLALLYDAYQKALQSRNVYDDAGQFWHAAEIVAQGAFGPFGDLALLVIDGFQDFAPAQLDVIEALSRRAARTLITLTWQADGPNLFTVTGRTRDRLRDRFGGRLMEIATDEPSGLGSSLERVRTRLFGPSELVGAAPKADGSIRIIRAAGRTREVEEVARQIADRLREGAAAPASIAVLARSLEGYAPLIREIFPRYGFEFHVQRDLVPADRPIVRAAMALVQVQAEEYAFRAVARVLKSNYFSPEAFGADAETAREAIRLAREANVWKGRASYFKGLDYLRSRTRCAADAEEDSGEAALSAEAAARRLAAIDRVEAFLKRLFDGLALPVKATRRALAARLGEIVQAAGFWAAGQRGTPDAARARDLKTLAAFRQVLEDVALLDEETSDEVPLEMFVQEVTQGLTLTTVPSEEPADAPVIVMDVRQSRALGFDDVFVLGVAEKTFPQRGRRHPFFDDAERETLRKRGVDLADAGHDAAQEMFLYYMAVTRARRRLVLSYSSLDAQGRPALPSHYLEELAGLFSSDGGGRALPLVEVGTRDLDLPPERVRTERELLASAMFSLWRRGGTSRADEPLGVLHALLERGRAAETALTGLALEWEREHGERFGPFDGVLAAASILENLCQRFPGESVLSAGRLEAFGTCPFTFLAKELLGLKATEEPSPDLGPLEVGLIYHGLLERFFSALAASLAAGGRLTAEGREEALRLLDRTADAYFKHLEAYGRVGSAALWKVQKQNILRDVRRLVDWHIQNLSGWRAAYTEVPFGATGPGPVKPPGRRDSVALDGPHGPVRLRGRIDRIDLALGDEPGYQVIDYKSGGGPTPKDMAAGTSFQLPVYLWAAEALLEAAERGDLARAFFLPIRDPKKRAMLSTNATKKHPEGSAGPALERAAEYIRRFIDAMRRGLYPVYPRTECPGHCEFQDICRFAEWRIQRKWEAHPLRELERIRDEAEEGEEDEA